MAYRLIWAPSARLDLKELASYIAESRPRASASFVKKCSARLSTYLVFPNQGGSSPNLTTPISERSFESLAGSCTESNQKITLWKL